jgi:hypothetical protein
MGGSRDSCNGTRHSAIEHLWMESEAFKICEGWMQQEGVSPNKFTFVQVIKACAGLGTLEDGRLVHK